ncbi:MAG: YbgC/FadM family acyl-CoA thioesterase [Gallionella sp.]|nr:YbgC/FadM family acyl-CoA thioesterase [Gallionella sp.]
MSKLKIFSLPVRVYFQDTDAGGVVYHASYVNFMERARTEWLRECYGYSNAGLMKEFGVVFVVRSLKLDYLKPALLDDLLDVTAQIKDVGRSRLTLLQNVRRRHGVAEQLGREPPLRTDTCGGGSYAHESGGRGGDEVLTEAEVHLVCVSLESFKPVSVPEVLSKQWKK